MLTTNETMKDGERAADSWAEIYDALIAGGIEDLRARVFATRAASQATVKGDERRPAKSHCQNGGDVCLAGNRDGVCCPEDSCDIDDGVRTAPRTYTTQPGESVMGIALRECGDEKLWRHILACNPEFARLLPHEYFPVGTVLTLPAAQDGAQ